MKRVSFASVLAIFTLTFVLSSAAILALPTPTKANGFTDALHNFSNRFNNRYHNQNGNDYRGDKNHDRDKDKNYCREHGNDSKCHPVSVPEFGLIPGIVTAIGSAGTYLALRNRV